MAELKVTAIYVSRDKKRVMIETDYDSVEVYNVGGYVEGDPGIEAPRNWHPWQEVK